MSEAAPDLFSPPPPGAPPLPVQPLAARMRPRTLDDVFGQDRILAPGKLLRRAIDADRLTSIVLFGPPGCGKTTLAEVIARTTRRAFERTSGVLGSVPAMRKTLDAARARRALSGRETILFIDEIHRFNRAQQDVLLPYLEEGAVTLIGATTQNPFFFINTPLLSRSQVFQLEPLSREAVSAILRRALAKDDTLLRLRVSADDDAIAFLAEASEGDARKALGALEIAALSTPPGPNGAVCIDRAAAEESIQRKVVRYDAEGDEHYDTISAFIKSVRGSDPNAALYWLAKMLHAGEDPRFVARRLVILASEDVGNADPRAISVAVAAMQAVEFVGMPEARISLAQAATYLASAPKSNASYMGLEEAATDVREGRVLPVPRPLRSTGSSRAAKAFGHVGYQYAHDFPGHVVDQEYVPTSKVYYRPTTEGYEKVISERLAHFAELRAAQRAARLAAERQAAVEPPQEENGNG